MKPFFDSKDKINLLTLRAFKWRGTPWMANSDALQVGVSCHNLPRILYIETRALTNDFPKLVGDPTQTRYAKESAMEKFLDARPEFQKIEQKELQPGDLVGMRIFHTTDHLGIILPGMLFIHVLMHKKTCFDMIKVPPWSQRLTRCWRLVHE